MKDKTAEEERQEVLVLLHQKDLWDERLLSDVLFGKTVETVLTPRERFVLEMKVEGKSESYIVKVLRMRSPQHTFAFTSLDDIKRQIKQKLKDGFSKRLPGWIRSRSWRSGKEEREVRDFYDKHPEFLEEES